MAKTCLIAENDPWDLQLLRLHAERLGFSVVHVYEAGDVLPTARQVQPDIIILEKDLPGKLKYQELVGRLWSSTATSRVAVLLLLHEREGMSQPTASAHVHCLYRPITYESLRSTFEQAGVIPSDR